MKTEEELREEIRTIDKQIMFLEASNKGVIRRAGSTLLNLDEINRLKYDKHLIMWVLHG